MRDFVRFIKEGLRHPGEIAAVSPSSSALAEEMFHGVTFRGGNVLELGPGTGVFTARALAKGCHSQNLHLVEMNREFSRSLAIKFPGVQVHNTSAADIASLGIPEFETVLSGLPVLNMPMEVQRAILSGIFGHLMPGGTYIQFTYGVSPPYPLDLMEEFGLDWERGPRVWRNLPPATVYRFRSKSRL